MTQKADLIIANARVFTADPTHPQAEAVAIQGNRILFVGSTADTMTYRAPHTQLIDGEENSLLPGFIDSHFHLLAGSLDLDNILLEGVNSLTNLETAVHTFLQANPQREWLIGNGLRYNIAPGQQPLTRHHLDHIVADRPFLIHAYDYHTVWANTCALKLANLLENGQVVGPNSEIVLEADGLATGELREPGASKPLTNLIPLPTETQKRAALHKGLAQAAQLGLTSIHNMDGNLAQLALYAALEDLGELTLRVYCPYSIKPETPESALAEAVTMQQTFQNQMARSGCVKFFMDGVVESFTALLLDEYPERPGWYGDALYSVEHFNRMATAADRLGLQIFVHAVGDGAVRRTLDGFAAAQQANGVRDSRHRVEHIELIHPADLPRFAELGVVASMQPLHCPERGDGPDIWSLRAGQDRWWRSFAWQTVRQAGARLVFGSDWPVVSQSPLRGIHTAVNRQPWLPHHTSQAQTLHEAILGYTRDAAYAEFQEHEKGQLRLGYLADLVLLSEDIFAVPAAEIETRVKPLLTICNGRIVFTA